MLPSRLTKRSSATIGRIFRETGGAGGSRTAWPVLRGQGTYRVGDNVSDDSAGLETGGDRTEQSVILAVSVLRKNSGFMQRGPGCTRGEVRLGRSEPQFGSIGRNGADGAADAGGNLAAERGCLALRKSVVGRDCNGTPTTTRFSAGVARLTESSNPNIHAESPDESFAE